MVASGDDLLLDWLIWNNNNQLPVATKNVTKTSPEKNQIFITVRNTKISVVFQPVAEIG